MVIRLTRFHLILERLGTVHNQLLQRNGTLGDLQLEQLLKVLRVVEVEHLLVPVIRRFDEVEQDIDDLQQEFPRLGPCCRVRRQQICKEDEDGEMVRFNLTSSSSLT